MAFFNTCPICGANLDPGESCDCQEEREIERQKMQSMLKVGKGGQIQMLLEQGVSRVAEKSVV